MGESDKVQADHVVSIKYKLMGEDGVVLDSSEPDEPLSYVHGRSQLLPALETAIEGMAVGDSRTVDLAAAQAYGEHDESKVLQVPRDRFEFEVQVGHLIEAETAHGHKLALQVVEVGEESVTLDGNHPLAGKALTFEVEVVGVRPATEEDLHCGTGEQGCEGCGHSHHDHGMKN